MHNGAEAKVTIEVADEIGRPVTNANARVFFRMSSGSSEGKRATGVTNAEGKFMAEGRTTDSVFIEVEKNGYYATHQQYNAASRDPERLKDGRWLPWNPTIPVVLREIRNPIPMYVKRFEGRFPNEQIVGFDCEVGDFVAPHGLGETPDFLIRTGEIGLSSIDQNGGFLVLPSYSNSAFKSDYFAPENGYVTNLSSRVVVDDRNGRTKSVLYDYGDDYGFSRNYLVFKSRIKRDTDGKIISANYGKFYGNFEYWRKSVKFLYYFNPTPSDRNIEFDGTNNLFRPEWNSKLNWSQEP